MRVILNETVGLRRGGHDIPLTLTLSHQGRENREYRGERRGGAPGGYKTRPYESEIATARHVGPRDDRIWNVTPSISE